MEKLLPGLNGFGRFQFLYINQTISGYIYLGESTGVTRGEYIAEVDSISTNRGLKLLSAGAEGGELRFCILGA